MNKINQMQKKMSSCGENASAPDDVQQNDGEMNQLKGLDDKLTVDDVKQCNDEMFCQRLTGDFEQIVVVLQLLEIDLTMLRTMILFHKVSR
jgi:hypothetical protein